MSETYRCTNAFSFGDAIYPGGIVVDESDPILSTHATHFARVNVTTVAATETTSAAPAEHRTRPSAPKPKADVKPKPAAPKVNPDA